MAEDDVVESVECAECGAVVCFVAEKDASVMPDVFCEDCVEGGEDDREAAAP